MKSLPLLLLFFVLTQSTMAASLTDKKLQTILSITIPYILLQRATPTFVNDSNISIAENNISALTVEFNSPNSVTYAISNGDSSLFDINSSTGVVTFKNAPDYESGNILYTFTVTATDSKGKKYTQDVSIHITNVTDTVPTLTAFTGSIEENKAIGTAIGKVVVSNSGDTAITSFDLNDSTNFEINASGDIKSKVIFDYESQTSYHLTVTATNTAGVSTAVTVDISIINVTDTVPTLTAFSGSIEENKAIGTAIGKVVVSNSGDTAITSFDLNDSTNFEINASGDIKSKASFDYESKTSYQLTVTATNTAGVSTPVTVDISIINIIIEELKKTGQILSYDAGGSAISTTIARDDGHYATTVGLAHNYERNATSQTVIDLVTGLEWADDSNVSSVTKQWVTTANFNDGNYSDTSGDTATTYCSSLRLGGYNNWRLPSIDELVYITDKGKTNPPSIEDSIFQNTASSYYWSSTTYAYSTGNAWVVYFNDGDDNLNYKYDSDYVRCVRARQ